MTEQSIVERPLPDGWRPLSESGPYNDYYVWLLIGTAKQSRPEIGIFRKGVFFGREVEGWWTRETIAENGRPTCSMWVNGLVMGWRPYNDTTALTANAEAPQPPANEEASHQAQPRGHSPEGE